jgi:hypothetical protein
MKLRIKPKHQAALCSEEKVCHKFPQQTLTNFLKISAEGSPEMGDLHFLVNAIEVFSLPMIGFTALISSKVTSSRLGSWSEYLYLGVLLCAGLATCRTLLAGETTWFLHALTMALLIVGAVAIPAAASTLANHQSPSASLRN